MVKKIVTIGSLLDVGLIKRDTKVKISTENLRSLGLIKALPKKKFIKIEDLNKVGMVKNG